MLVTVSKITFNQSNQKKKKIIRQFSDGKSMLLHFLNFITIILSAFNINNPPFSN